MKIALTLLSCTAMALLLTALTSHHQAAAAATSPHKTSEALADAMSSHGIELGDADVGLNAPAANFKPVAYTQTGTQ